MGTILEEKNISDGGSGRRMKVTLKTTFEFGPKE